MQENIAKDMLKTTYLQTVPYLKKERTQKFVSLVLTLLALSFFGFFAISPTISTILKLQKELADKQFVFKKLEIKIRDLSDLKNQYTILNQRLELPIVTNAIPTIPDAHILFAQVQQVAKENNVSISKIESDEIDVIPSEQPKENYGSYTFSILGAGSYDNIYAFLSKITNMQRIVDTEIFSMNNSLNPDSNLLEFNIKAKAFFKD